MSGQARAVTFAEQRMQVAEHHDRNWCIVSLVLGGWVANRLTRLVKMSTSSQTVLYGYAKHTFATF